MTRVLRYPRMSAMVCVLTFACAAARDMCVDASLDSWALILMTATIALLLLCFMLLSCRFFVDVQGVGVGFLLHVRRTDWDDIASLGLLYCNSRRRYFYGMYRRETDFIHLLHRAPRCGNWGFVVPASRKLIRAICTHCPFDVDLSPMPRTMRKGKLKMQRQQAAFYLLAMIPGAFVAFATGVLMLLTAAQTAKTPTVVGLTLGAMGLFSAGLALLYRVFNTINTCPGYDEAGVCAGRSLYLPWEEVRFGYVHRLARMSGLFLLSRPLEEVRRRNAPPILCLSMPDTRILLLAYLTYCPHANKIIED